MFGQSTASPFGQLNAAFGAPKWSTFGSANSQPQQGNSFFTQPSLFGNSATQSSFPFGTTSITNSQATSIFGSPATSSFNNAGTSIFGNTKPNFGSSFLSLFGSTSGTTVKFSAPVDIEPVLNSGNSFFSRSTINIRLHCITCMPEYKAKSLEELRLEDYNANRKGPSQQQSNSLFGSASKSSGNSLFGSTNTFGSTGGGLFNQNNKSPFASIAPTSSSSFFGSNNNFNSNTNNSSSIFGQPNPFAQSNNAFGTSAFASSSPFGATMNSQPQQQNSLFGTTQSSNTLFGNNINQPSSIFGTANSGQANAFGSAAAPTTSIFGFNNVNENKPPALFGQNATMNTFGSQPNAFGNSTSNPFGTVNSQPQQGAPFGQTSANSIFSVNPTQSIFGAAANNNNSFGSFAPTTANIFGSNFNNTNQQPTLFSQNATTNTFGGQPNAFGSPTQQPQFGPFNPQPQQSFTDQNSPPPLNFDSDRIITRLQTLPYGLPQPLLTDSTPPPRRIRIHFIADPKTMNKYKINATSPVEVKVERVPSTGKSAALLFDSLDDESPEKLKCARDVFSPRPNIKQLVLNKKRNASFFKGASSPPQVGDSSKTSPALNNNESNPPPELNITNLASKQTTPDTSIEAIDKPVSEITIQNDNTPTTSSSAEKSSPTPEQQDSTVTEEENIATPSISYIPKCGLILNRTDYYTIPSPEECDAYYDAENDTCILECFTVGRIDYGSIYWKGPLNVKGINLDEIVQIRRKEVIVYSDDYDAKPPLGEGLNRPAQITLDQVWPVDKTTRKTITDLARLRDLKYPEKIEAATVKMDAIFKEYRPDTGSWVFDVKHF